MVFERRVLPWRLAGKEGGDGSHPLLSQSTVSIWGVQVAEFAVLQPPAIYAGFCQRESSGEVQKCEETLQSCPVRCWPLALLLPGRARSPSPLLRRVLPPRRNRQTRLRSPWTHPQSHFTPS